MTTSTFIRISSFLLAMLTANSQAATRAVLITSATEPLTFDVRPGEISDCDPALVLGTKDGGQTIIDTRSKTARQYHSSDRVLEAWIDGKLLSVPVIRNAKAQLELTDNIKLELLRPETLEPAETSYTQRQLYDLFGAFRQNNPYILTRNYDNGQVRSRSGVIVLGEDAGTSTPTKLQRSPDCLKFLATTEDYSYYILDVLTSTKRTIPSITLQEDFDPIEEWHWAGTRALIGVAHKYDRSDPPVCLDTTLIRYGIDQNSTSSISLPDYLKDKKLELKSATENAFLIVDENVRSNWYIFRLEDK